MSKFVAPRIALLAIAAAFFASACATESTDSGIAGPSVKGPASDVIVSDTREAAGNVVVCIGPTSPAGDYLVTSQAVQPATGAGTVVASTTITLPGSGCATVFTRTAFTPTCEAPGNPGNWVCDYPQSTITTQVVPQGSISGAAVTGLTCILDAGTLTPADCTEPDGTPGAEASVRANYYHGTQETYLFASDGSCALPSDEFGLATAGPFTFLGLSGHSIDVGSGGTYILGAVGLGPLNSGTMKKATIDGNLYKDPTATVNVVSDLKVLGTKITTDLSGASADAISASAVAAAQVNTQAALGNLTGNTTITGVSGLNVVSIASVNMTGKKITFAGPADAVFIINVLGGFNFRGSQMVLNSIAPHNILWNFVGPTGDVTIKDPSTSAAGVFLVPNRNFNGDKATIVGSVYAGKTSILHSGTQLVCEQL